jgi:hypothetical protein
MAPDFGMSAGARLMVIAYSSINTPSIERALAMRTRASRTGASGKPTMRKSGGPRVQLTSMVTRCGSSPTRALDRTEAYASGLPEMTPSMKPFRVACMTMAGARRVPG